MKLSYLYEGTGRDDTENPKAGGKEEEAEGEIAKTAKQRPTLGASKGVYRGPRSA